MLAGDSITTLGLEDRVGIVVAAFIDGLSMSRSIGSIDFPLITAEDRRDAYVHRIDPMCMTMIRMQHELRGGTNARVQIREWLIKKGYPDLAQAIMWLDLDDGEEIADSILLERS
jgi:hypothetical protein